MEIKLPGYFKYTVILLGLALLIYTLQQFKAVLMPLAFGLLFALLLLPLNRDLENKLRFPRPLAILASITMVILILGLIVWFLSMQLVSLTSELESISKNMQKLITKGQDFVYQNFGIVPPDKSQLIQNTIGGLQELTTTFLGSTISITTGALTILTLVPIFVFLLLYYRDHLEQFMFKFVAKDRRSGVIQTIIDIQHVVQSYISGLMIVIVVVALLNSAGLLILGVKYAVFFGVFASILTIIPYIGILIGASIPALFTLATTGELLDAVLVVLVFMFVQFLEGNFITPFVVGSKVSLNPFAAILALLVGGEVWGAAGMILSIPIIAMMKVIFDVYEPLQPFGFLLADIDEVKPKRRGRVRGWFDELVNGILRGKKNPNK
ncbi:AI-2E family transporter [Pontibacter chinhatensis]|uniref:Predicted PurR-regulated permease PerM n=1 Tax=Pontibacter chinhatensis TaxID=1436961 RepID=A0A1I2ZHR3_9BACT|nr:AI-2E family transporter [Pontibacter chinhatensis]SFH37368.1 Predicted PurR-regulated permease PerM [Pontibacter chinhatensis]